MWLGHPETRASLQGEGLTWRVCAFSCTTRHPVHLNSLHKYLRPHCVICVLSSESQFKMGKLGRTSNFLPTICPHLRRYVEFPIRRCRNLAKPLVDLQQGCNQGPCPELPRVISGRTTSTAVVSGWYSSPWQQVHFII